MTTTISATEMSNDKTMSDNTSGLLLLPMAIADGTGADEDCLSDCLLMKLFSGLSSGIGLTTGGTGILLVANTDESADAGQFGYSRNGCCASKYCWPPDLRLLVAVWPFANGSNLRPVSLGCSSPSGGETIDWVGE